MNNEIDPRNDRRGINELFEAMLSETDEHEHWNAIAVLQWRGTREILDRVSVLCRSACAIERTVGANVLGQLGVPERTFPKECGDVLLRMLETETDEVVLDSIFIGFSHLDDARVIPFAARFLAHPSSRVRHAIAFALAGREEPQAIDLLIRLTVDRDAAVRDWATFGLGSLTEVDTPDVRQALMARLDDSDCDARGEALVALAKRGDFRVIPALKRELSSGTVTTLAVEAASLIRSSELHAELVALSDWWFDDWKLLKRAIAASGPG